MYQLPHNLGNSLQICMLVTDEYLCRWFVQETEGPYLIVLKKWLKSPEGDLYTHITIIRLSVVTICTAHIFKIFSLQYLEKSK